MAKKETSNKLGRQSKTEEGIPAWIGLRELAELAGVNLNAIHEQAEKGIIKRDPKTRKFPAKESIKAYINFYREKTQGNDTQRLRKAKADKEELEVQRMQGTLITIDEACDKARRSLGPLASALKNQPVRVSKLVNPHDPEMALEVLEADVNTMLTDCIRHMEADYGLELMERDDENNTQS